MNPVPARRGCTSLNASPKFRITSFEIADNIFASNRASCIVVCQIRFLGRSGWLFRYTVAKQIHENFLDT